MSGGHVDWRIASWAWATLLAATTVLSHCGGGADGLTAAQMQRAVGLPISRVGTRLHLVVWNGSAPQRLGPCIGGRAATVIVAGCTPCNISHIRSWHADALARGDRLITIVDASPAALPSAVRRWHIPGEVYSAHLTDVCDRLGVSKLPVVVFVAPSGLVTGIVASREM